MTPKPNAETPETQPPPTPETAVTGGPGVGAAPAVGVERRTVKIGSREFSVDPEMAEAIAQRERDYEAGIQKQGTELGELRARQREYEEQQARLREAVSPSRPTEPEIDTLLFTNPKEALARHEAQILARIDAQRQVERSREEFWTGFYAQHQDLSRTDDHWLIESVLQRHFRDLATLTPDEGRKKLGDLSRQAILGIIQKRTPANGTASRTVVEGATARSERPAAPREDEGPKTLSEVIIARKARRRAAPATR